MVLEMAVLQVKRGMASQFLAAFRSAEPIISSAVGHIAHELHRCIEDPDRFLLLVRWQTLKDHTEGFRGSPDYQRWKALLHHFYDPFPEVLHYELATTSANYGRAPRVPGSSTPGR
jgi:heme-degrading monooxygenase HmoA